MCHRVHKGNAFSAFRNVKPTGIAWKLFSISRCNSKLLIPLMKEIRGYQDEHNNEIDITIPGTVIKWQDFRGIDHGFCFFTRKEEAISVIQPFGGYNCVSIRKVKYSKPLGSFYSTEVNGKKQRVLIAKEFELV